MSKGAADVPRHAERITDALAIYPAGLGGADVFYSRTLTLPVQGRGVFGGQILAQALAAAGKTVETGLSLHSVHSYFLAAANPLDSIEYRVRRLQDRLRYAARAVFALQRGNIVFTASSSYQRNEPEQPSFQNDLLAPPTTHSNTNGPATPGVQNALRSPSTVTSGKESYSLESAEWAGTLLSPEDAAPTTARFDRVLSQANLAAPDTATIQGFLFDRATSPIEIRDADGSMWNSNGLALPGTKQAFWFRTKHRMGDISEEEGEDTLVDANKLAVSYASDFNLLATTAKALDIPIPGMLVTINHSIWFDRTDFFAHDWMLYIIHAQSASNGRGLALGCVYRRDGALIAVTVQEGVIRAPAKKKTQSKL